MNRATSCLHARLVWLIGIGTLLAALGSAAGQNIPPTRVPETPEPDLADPRAVPKTQAPETLVPGRPRTAPNLIGVAPRPAVDDDSFVPPSADPPTPVVSLRLRAPSNIGIGAKEVLYIIVVENTSRAAAHHVEVSNPVPKNARFLSADPEPKDRNAAILRWEFGTLAPGVSREIKLALQPSGDGDITNIARVHYEHGQQVTTVIKRPALTLKRIAPQYSHESDTIPVKLIVENTSQVEVKNVVVTDVVDEGLEHSGPDKTLLQRREWTIELLGPGQKRELDFALQAKRQGVFTGRATARAEFLPDIKADTWTVSVGKALLDVKVSGPEKPVYVSQPVRYQIVVKNQGTIPMDNVAVAFGLPPGMKVKQASFGAEQFTSRVQWVVPRFEAGGMRTFSLLALSTESGTVPIFVEALGRGHSSKADLKTEFVGAAALRLRIHESADPIQVGEGVTYTLTVQNTGTSTASDVRVKISLPTVQLDVDMKNLGLTQGEQGSYIWGPLNVRPGQTQTIVVTAKATSAGKVRFHAEMTAPELTSGPVTWEEETTIIDKSK